MASATWLQGNRGVPNDRNKVRAAAQAAYNAINAASRSLVAHVRQITEKQAKIEARKQRILEEQQARSEAQG